MSGRHRRPLPPRPAARRVLAASASGLAAALAAAPLAHADEAPAGPGVTSAPSSDTPSSPATSSDAPSSPAPSSDAPSSDAPSSPASSPDTPSKSASSSPASSPDAPSRAPTSAPKKAAKAVVQADYGRTKVYLGAKLKDGSYAPNGTAGSVITVHETGPNAPAQDFTCTTAATAPGGTASSCTELGPFGSYIVGAGDTATITQTSAPDGTVADPTPQTVGVCTTPDEGPFAGCNATVEFTDTGLPPSVTAAETTITVQKDDDASLDPDDQVDTHGAPPTSVDVSDPAHGTVEVVEDSTTARAATPVSGAFHLVYTPTNGYVGPDTFSYTVTTGNGTSARVTVSVRVVGAAPTLRDDSERTDAGQAVTVDVLDNDADNGGGTLALQDVSTPKHGTVRLAGGQVVYTPDDGYTGRDSFTYTASTYSGTGTATVSLTVSPVGTVGPVPPPITPSEPSSAAPDGTTADTGTPTALLLEVAGSLLVAGAGASVVGRRRRLGGHA